MYIRKKLRGIEDHLKPFAPTQAFYVVFTSLEDRLADVAKVGFSTPPVAGERLLPSGDFGIASRRNADGEEIVHKDRPLETHYRQREWTWKQFRGRYDHEERTKIVDVPYKRYLKYVTSIASSTAPQLAVAELLANGRYERYLREVRGRYASAVARMSDAVMKVFPDGTRISQPQGGFVIWVELPEDTDSFALARRALSQGVSIAPGPIFSASGKYGNFVRLSSARTWDARLERALLVLAKLI